MSGLDAACTKEKPTMKLTTPTFTPLFLVALGLAGNALPACAQDADSFYRPLSLAPAEASFLRRRRRGG